MTIAPAERLYDEDFFAWTQLQAKELRRFGRTRPNVALDVRHIAEEIADLGTERRDSLRSWTARLIEHLLLLEHSPAAEPRRGWIDEVVNFRGDIERRLTRSLRRDLERRRELLYADERGATCNASSSATAKRRSWRVCPSAARGPSTRSSATSGRPNQAPKAGSEPSAGGGHGCQARTADPTSSSARSRVSSRSVVSTRRRR